MHQHPAKPTGAPSEIRRHGSPRAPAITLPADRGGGTPCPRHMIRSLFLIVAIQRQIQSSLLCLKYG
jgi:hypothetical protein